MIHVEVAGEMVDGVRCANCGQADVLTGIMLAREADGTVVPEVAQKCRGCGQIGCDA